MMREEKEGREAPEPHQWVVSAAAEGQDSFAPRGKEGGQGQVRGREGNEPPTRVMRSESDFGKRPAAAHCPNQTNHNETMAEADSSSSVTVTKVLGRLLMAVVALQIPFAVVPDPAVAHGQRRADDVIGISPLEITAAHLARLGKDRGPQWHEYALTTASCIAYPGAVAKAAWKHAYCTLNVDAPRKQTAAADDANVAVPDTDEFDEFESDFDNAKNTATKSEEGTTDQGKGNERKLHMARAIAGGALVHGKCDTSGDFKLPQLETIMQEFKDEEYWDAALSMFGRYAKEFLCGCALVVTGTALQLVFASKLSFGGMCLLYYAAHSAPAAQPTTHVLPAMACAASQLNIFDAFTRGARRRAAATAAATNASGGQSVPKETGDAATSGGDAKKTAARRRRA